MQGIKLNEHFLSLIRSAPDFSLVTEPSLTLTVFRITPQHPKFATLSEEALNDLNRSYYNRLSARSEMMLTQTKLNDTFCIRFAIGAARTEKKHIDNAWKFLQEEAETAIGQWKDAHAI